VLYGVHNIADFGTIGEKILAASIMVLCRLNIVKATRTVAFTILLFTQ